MRRRTYFALALAAVALATPRIVTDVVDTSFYIIDEDTPGDEDAYVLADFGSVESELDGDLTIAVYEDLSISGTVTGDVVVAAGGSVIITDTGFVGGSVRGVARRVIIDGRVGDDVAVAAISTEVRGTIGRDLIGAGGSADVFGAVGRNVQGWFFRSQIDAIVGNDVDVRVGALDVGADTIVAGDLLYRADSDAAVADGADVGGTLARLPTRSPFVVRVSLALFTIFGLIAFTLLGLFVLTLSRDRAPRAAGAVVTRTGRVAWVGFAAVVGVPAITALIAFAIQPFLAKLAVVVLFFIAAIVAVLFGPIPALAALGDRLTRGRAGLFGGFVVGVVVWRLIVWAIPLIGLFVSILALAFGVGAWIVSWWDRRAERPRVRRLLASGGGAEEEADAWEPPLPPLAKSESAAQGSSDLGTESDSS
ncbi:MAG: polymer-forming cytoskeletal protein [Acidimicrobiia bacterium]|nr:polymer-forming cytoskeletal protein [Acidimicrobiia bacterium]